MALKKSELYSSLWSSCDELRGGMDASQYKDYVLVLLFVKYVSDKYAGVRYAPITIPDGASFQDMVALKGKSDIGDQINKRIIGPLAAANNLSDNSNVEEELLTAYLAKRGYAPRQIAGVLHRLRVEATNPNRSLYENNRAVYTLLRYGVQVKVAADENTETIWLIDWNEPEQNDFAIAEEVTLRGGQERRPDLVLYVNGVAVGVIELKNSRKSIGHGIRQNLSNQQPEFNAPFFSTVQFIFAGNDSEGLQYGAVLTQEKYFLRWKEDEQENAHFKLDKYLLKMCAKERLIELMHDFVLFDGGVKKLPRVHQYFGIKRAQEYVRRRQGGIIWHTQGSGKSIVMVLLAKWILENLPTARVVIVTDRDELDKQIEGVFTEAGEPIVRTNSGRDLMTQLPEVNWSISTTSAVTRKLPRSLKSGRPSG